MRLRKRRLDYVDELPEPEALDDSPLLAARFIGASGASRYRGGY